MMNMIIFFIPTYQYYHFFLNFKFHIFRKKQQKKKNNHKKNTTLHLLQIKEKEKIITFVTPQYAWQNSHGTILKTRD